MLLCYLLTYILTHYVNTWLDYHNDSRRHIKQQDCKSEDIVVLICSVKNALSHKSHLTIFYVVIFSISPAANFLLGLCLGLVFKWHQNKSCHGLFQYKATGFVVNNCRNLLDHPCIVYRVGLLCQIG